MSGKRSRAIRRVVYGPEHSLRFRTYTLDRRGRGFLVADGRRRVYKGLKRAWVRDRFRGLMRKKAAQG
jgi:hypothetical protein